MPVYLGDKYKNFYTATKALYLITGAEWEVGGSEASSLRPDLQEDCLSAWFLESIIAYQKFKLNKFERY